MNSSAKQSHCPVATTNAITITFITYYGIQVLKKEVMHIYLLYRLCPSDLGHFLSVTITPASHYNCNITSIPPPSPRLRN